MLGVAALASRLWPPSVQEEVMLSRELRTSCDARPGRILRAAPQVMSLQGEHDSNSDDFVSHPNDLAQQPAHAGQALNQEKTSIAWPVCCSIWFASNPISEARRF